VHLIRILERDEVAFIDAKFDAGASNPLNLPQVHECRSSVAPGSAPPELAAQVRAIDPDAVVGFGFLPSRLLKKAAPERRVVLVTGACRQAQEYVTSGRAHDAVSLTRDLAAVALPPAIVHATEREAVDLADLVVTHSPLTLDLMQRFYPGASGKIWREFVSFAEWITEGAAEWRDRARPFDERDVDVLFIATDWKRGEKNFSFVAAIAEQMAPAAVHVIGEVPQALSGVTHHGFLAERGALFEILARTRVVVCPSLIDASPGVLFEAAAMGCNIVASKNCGNWEMCNAELLVDPFAIEGFVACTKRALVAKYDDRLAEFLARGSYDDFVATLAAFARPFETVTMP
jgi:glycosyltransferase involved in cell wall biosynthesis